MWGGNLTKSNLDQKLVLKIIQNFDLNKLNEKDKKYQEILKNFLNNDFSLLDTREIQFLNKNSTELWTPYMIHRYNFEFYENNSEKPDFPIEDDYDLALENAMKFFITHVRNKKKFELNLFEKSIETNQIILDIKELMTKEKNL